MGTAVGTWKSRTAVICYGHRSLSGYKRRDRCERLLRVSEEKPGLLQNNEFCYFAAVPFAL